MPTMKSWDLFAAVVTCIAISILSAMLIPLHTDRGWVDPVTGSTKAQTSWLGIPQAPVVRPSAIERWIIRHEGSHAEQWQFLHETTQFVMGKSYGCGNTPVIYPLSRSDVSERFIQGSTDSQIAEFVRIMRTGTVIEKDNAVQAATEVALGQPSR